VIELIGETCHEKQLLTPQISQISTRPIPNRVEKFLPAASTFVRVFPAFVRLPFSSDFNATRRRGRRVVRGSHHPVLRLRDKSFSAFPKR
jgi:hypothetical protein